MEPEDYPTAPNLAIEMDASPPEVDRSSVYAELMHEEVWRFDGAEVKIEQLQTDGTYAEVPTSQYLPVSGVEICLWLLDDDATVELV